MLQQMRGDCYLKRAQGFQRIIQQPPRKQSGATSFVEDFTVNHDAFTDIPGWCLTLMEFQTADVYGTLPLPDSAAINHQNDMSA